MLWGNLNELCNNSIDQPTNQWPEINSKPESSSFLHLFMFERFSIQIVVIIFDTINSVAQLITISCTLSEINKSDRPRTDKIESRHRTGQTENYQFGHLNHADNNRLGCFDSIKFRSNF